MKTYFPPLMIKVDTETVLAVLRDHFRLLNNFELENLGFEMSIEDLRFDYYPIDIDILAWEDLAQDLNRQWNLQTDLETWRAVLEPGRHRTVRDLCEFLASNARLPQFQPARIMGKECAEAGAFLTVRHLLAEAGADVKRLKPSDALDPFVTPHLEVFVGPIAKLAPGKMPVIQDDTPSVLTTVGCASFGLGTITLLIGELFDIYQLSLMGCGLIALAMITSFIQSCFKPKFGFENLKTFRDLAVCLTGGPCQTRASVH